MLAAEVRTAASLQLVLPAKQPAGGVTLPIGVLVLMANTDGRGPGNPRAAPPR
jgi:hypothetical protein